MGHERETVMDYSQRVDTLVGKAARLSIRSAVLRRWTIEVRRLMTRLFNQPYPLRSLDETLLKKLQGAAATLLERIPSDQQKRMRKPLTAIMHGYRWEFTDKPTCVSKEVIRQAKAHCRLGELNRSKRKRSARQGVVLRGVGWKGDACFRRRGGGGGRSRVL